MFSKMNYTAMISFTICVVLIGNIALVVNILKTQGQHSELKAADFGTNIIGRIENIMSDSGIGDRPHLSNATLSPGNGVLYPGSLDEAIASRLLMTRQRMVVNNQSYKYKLEAKSACKNKKVELVIGLTTLAENFAERANFRAEMNELEPWRKSLRTVHIFFLGAPRQDVARDVQEKIAHESLKHDDIVQGDFIDSPQTASTKTMSLLKWVTMNCAGALFVVKASPKCELSVPMLLVELTQAKEGRHLFMLGHLAPKDLLEKMETDPKSAIPYSVYKLEEYPEFLDGDAVGFPMEVAALMFQFALTLPLFPLENVFFTGIVATLLKIPRIDNPALYFNNCSDIPKEKLLGPLNF